MIWTHLEWTTNCGPDLIVQHQSFFLYLIYLYFFCLLISFCLRRKTERIERVLDTVNVMVMIRGMYLHVQGLSERGLNRHTFTWTLPLANGYLMHHHLIACVTLTAIYMYVWIWHNQQNVFFFTLRWIKMDWKAMNMMLPQFFTVKIRLVSEQCWISTKCCTRTLHIGLVEAFFCHVCSLQYAFCKTTNALFINFFQ